jgi:hypothetical protein
MPQFRKEQLNLLSANWSTYTYSAAAGDTFTDLPAGFESSTVTQVSGGETSGPTRGIVTSAPDNYIKLRLEQDGSSLVNNGVIFGRLTYLSGVYTLTYYVLSGGSEVSATLPGSGIYNVTMLFPEVMKLEEIPSNSTITFAQSEALGGSGAIIIPDGGNISGTYASDVFCEGNANIVGNLWVKGDLIVDGDLINSDGYSASIAGDLRAVNLNFDRADTSQPQGNLNVGGDLLFSENMYYRPTAVGTVDLTVNGNIIGGSSIGSEMNCNGYEDTNGLNVFVGGNLIVGYLDVSGGDADSIGAGNGGTIFVRGDLNVTIYLSSSGGDSAAGLNAGNAGEIIVYGNLSNSYNSGFFGSVLLLDGGDSIGADASAGNGGTLTVFGNANLRYCDMVGGYCDSSIESNNSGQGGSVNIFGSAVAYSLDVSGGDRGGTLTAEGSATPPHAGSIFIQGNLTSYDAIGGTGGTISSSNFAPSFAGDGAVVSVEGDCNAETILVSGGDFIFSSSLSYGAGNAGDFDVGGNLYCGNIYADGGNCSSGTNAGNGADISILGSANCYFIFMPGGNATESSAGDAGYLEIRGNFLCSEISIYGGSCDSSVETHNAGLGGYIECDSFNVDNFSIYGGTRSGATTVSYASQQPNAGSILVRGDFHCEGWAECFGGDVITDEPNALGGDGANIDIFGSAYMATLQAQGGNCDLNRGGNGGNISIVSGNLNISNQFLINGGDSSYNSFGGGNGGSLSVNGNLNGNIDLFAKGGVGTDAPGGSGGTIQIKGNVNLQELDVSGGSSVSTDGSYSAGNGGSITIQGNSNIEEASFFGGEGTQASGGNGGNFYIYGMANSIFVIGFGGNCDSDYETNRAGTGGSVFAQSAVFYNVDVSGGNRFGTLSSSGSQLPADSGNIQINGSITAMDIYANGGAINTLNFAPSSAGSGGNIQIGGVVNVSSDIDLYGGDASVGNAGDGGTLNVPYGNVITEGINASGGQSSQGSGGDGGGIYCTFSDVGGVIYLDGGDSVNGNGGNAGEIYASSIRAFISLSGGNCDSSDENHVAGNGGYIACINLDGTDVYIDGGDRSGSLVSSGSVLVGPSAGSVNVNGQVNLLYLYGRGGDVTTNLKCAPGGNGAEVLIGLGNTVSSANIAFINISGGDSNGYDGGASGQLKSTGSAVISEELLAVGGISYPSLDAAAARNGMGPALVQFSGGVTARYVTLQDGYGSGSPPLNTGSTEVILRLAGSCTFHTLDMTSRQGFILPHNDDSTPASVIFKVQNMPDKSTLNVPEFTDLLRSNTSDISSDLEDSVFISGQANWYKLTGTAI